MRVKNYFSTNLLGLLKEKNITQKKLAQLLNTKESVISLWVTGKTKPSSKSILKLAEIFDIPVGELFDKKQNTFDNMQKSYDNKNIDLIINLIQENNKKFESEISLLKKEIELLKIKLKAVKLK